MFFTPTQCSYESIKIKLMLSVRNYLSSFSTYEEYYFGSFYFNHLLNNRDKTVALWHLLTNSSKSKSINFPCFLLSLFLQPQNYNPDDNKHIHDFLIILLLTIVGAYHLNKYKKFYLQLINKKLKFLWFYNQFKISLFYLKTIPWIVIPNSLNLCLNISKLKLITTIPPTYIYSIHNLTNRKPIFYSIGVFNS